jgi:predicted transcriptional regulator
LKAKMPPERLARIDRMTQELREEMDLAQLRGALDMSQATLAEALHVEQPAIAKLEKRTDMYVSTLRRFVEAMGGELEITARFANHNIRIRSFQELRGRTKRKAVASD